MDEKTLRRIRWSVYIFVVLLALIIVYTLYRTPSPLAWNIARAAALFGYSTTFLAILSHEYMREMRKLFGKPFLTVHHILARTGLVLIILHPITVAVLTRDPKAFVPIFNSLRTFLTWGGRPALYLFIIAILAAVLRGRIKNTWKFIHWLNYLAFALVFVHSWLLGTNVSHGLLKFIWPVMAGIVLVVFVRKHLLQGQKRQH